MIWSCMQSEKGVSLKYVYCCHRVSFRSQFYPEVEPEVVLSAASVQKGNDTGASKFLLFKHMARSAGEVETVSVGLV